MAQQTENNNMTAVEWLVNEIENHYIINNGRLDPTVVMRLKRQAQQMEKEQHKEAFKQSRQAKIFEKDMPPVWESFEQYYNETYGKE